MPRFPEVNEAPFQPDSETVSPDRPPQLNQAVCSCRCGCGCSIEGGGNNDEDGASAHSLETLVASNSSETDEEFPPASDGPEQHVNIEAFEAAPPFFRGNRDAQGFLMGFDAQVQLNELVLGMADQTSRLHSGRYAEGYDDLPDSMKNEPCGTDDHSVVSSDFRGSLRALSPGPGIGGWIEDVGVHFQAGHPLKEDEYRFLGAPLRLTPQRRHCRGLVASHLVVRDV